MPQRDRQKQALTRLQRRVDWLTQKVDQGSAGGAALSAGSGVSVGGDDAIEVIQLDASSGDVTETLPEPEEGAQVLYIRTDDTSANTATIEAPNSSDIYIFAETNAPTYDLSTRERVFLVSDGTSWYVEYFEGVGVETFQLDASGGNVTQTLPAPEQGAALVVSRIDDSANAATVETADTSSQEIRFPQGKDASSVDLRPGQSLLITADGTHWHVEEGQGLRAEAEDVTSDGATRESPRLTQTATYDSDTSGGVTSSDVSIERYVRTDTDGNAVLVYEHDGTEIARLTDAGRLETRKDQAAFMDGSLNSGQGTNSLLQIENGQGDVLTTDAASLQFTGSGISLTKSGDEITVDVSGGSGSDIDIEQNQTPIVGGATGVSFEGSGIDDVTNDGDGTATVSISKGSSTEVQEGGTAQVSDVTVLDFVGGDFSVATPTSGEAEVSLQNDTVTVAGNNVSLGGSTGVAHGDLSSIGSDDHHAKYTDSEAVNALQAHDGTGVDADTLDSHDESYFAALSEDETVTGQWEYQNRVDIRATFPDIRFIDTNEAKQAQLAVGGNSFGFQRRASDGSFETTVAAIDIRNGYAGFGGESNPSYAVDVSGTAAASTLRVGDYTVTEDSNGILGFFHSGTRVLEIDDSGVLRAKSDVVAFGLSGGSSTSGGGGFSIAGDGLTSPDGKTVEVDIGAGLTINNGILEADGSVGVSSVFGRTGDVTASGGDYSASQIDGFDSAAVSAVEGGSLTIGDGTQTRTVQIRSDVATPEFNDNTLELRDDDSPTISFHRPGTDGVELYWDGTFHINKSDVKFGGNTVWHDGNATSKARSAVEGTSDVADLVGDLGTSGQVPQTDGTNVSWVTLAAADISGVSPDSTPDAHHAVFEPADYTPVTTVEAHGKALAIDITGDADTLDSHDESYFAALSEDETVTGQWEYQNRVDIRASSPDIRFIDTNGAKQAQLAGGGNNFAFQRRASDGSFEATVAAIDITNGYAGFGGKATPSYAVDVNGTGNFSGDLYAAGSVGVGTTSPQKSLHIFGGGAADIRMRNNNDSDYWELNTRNSGRFDINRGGSNYLSVDPSGNVGIGTTSPSSPLDVVGDIKASGVGRFDITGDAESVDGLDGFQIARTDTSEIFTDQVRIDGPLAGSDNEIGNNDDYVLALGGKPYGVDDTDNTGDDRLGDGLLQTAHGKASDYRTYLQGGHGRVAHVWNAYYDSGASTWRSVVGNEAHSLVGIGNGKPGNVTGGGVTLATADAVNTANADNEQDAEDPITWNVGVHVDVDGKVGIGDITDPAHALEVGGDMRATGEVEAFLGSDRRLKTDLDPLGSALDKVGQLTGYGFDWREGDAVQPHKRGKTDVGLIAQEVEGVLPEAVKTFSGGHSEGYKSVSYDKLVPLLVEAIKDLRKQIEAQ